MLNALSIRDVILIRKLDLSFSAGLTVLTGETGAGKSVLLDSLGLVLGDRADQGLIATGAEQCSVTAIFSVGGPAAKLLKAEGLAKDEEVILRRTVGRDGRSRATINGQPIAIAQLRKLGALMVEMQGQHAHMRLADPTTHNDLLDAFGGCGPLRSETRATWIAWRETRRQLDAAREAASAARRDEDWLRHAVDELAKLKPAANEEEALAVERTRLQQAERGVEAISAALAELGPHSHGRIRSAGPAAALRAAARSLERLVTSSTEDGQSWPALLVPALAALERAQDATAEAEVALNQLADVARADPRSLELTEERLFALRAAARKFAVPVAELAALSQSLADRLAGLQSAKDDVAELERRAAAARGAYVMAAARLSEARREAAVRIEAAVATELPPLRLAAARVHVRVTGHEEHNWSEHGTDDVEILIATNAGQTPGPIGKIASGGELSRLALAMQVVLRSVDAVPTLIFDEVDSGIGGATAAAVGERLARLAGSVQVLVVTHSPQVAARGSQHLRVVKQVASGKTVTTIAALSAGARQEELARMLAGERVTDAARAAAADLLGSAA